MFCCNRCCCRQTNRCCGGSNFPTFPNFPNFPIRPPVVTPVRDVAAQFSSPAAVTVTTGSVIPLSTTVFNNSEGAISNANGTVSLTGPGTYLVQYSALATNTGTAATTATIGFSTNGAIQTGSGATETIPAGETAMLTNSAIISVPANMTTSFALILTSPETLSILPNVVVTRLS